MKVGSKNKRNRGKDFKGGDPSVPPGWRIRINAQQKESFRSPSGVFFHSRQKMYDFLLGEGKTDSIMLEIVKSKIQNTGRKKRNPRRKGLSEAVWVDNDPTVPAGWKLRVVTCSDGHTVTFFKTPEGTSLKGRKAALQ